MPADACTPDANEDAALMPASAVKFPEVAEFVIGVVNVSKVHVAMLTAWAEAPIAKTAIVVAKDAIFICLFLFE